MEGLRLVAVGDLMFGDSAPRFGFGCGSAVAAQGRDSVGSHLRALLPSGDLIIGNLETPLSNIHYPLNDYLNQQYLAASETAQLLADSGFNYLNLANNHMLQHGEEAFWHTVSMLEKAGICPIGLLENGIPKPVLRTINGTNIAIFGFSMRPEVYNPHKLCYAQAQGAAEIISAIDSLTQKPDLLIVTLHWGWEFLTNPAPSQIELAAKLLDYGVDVIIGHHPHVLQPLYLTKNKLVAFSLGNFAFDMWRLSCRQSAILSFRYSKQYGCHEIEVQPILIDEDGLPRLSTDENSREILRALNWPNLVQIAQSSVSEEDYHLQAMKAEGLNALHNRSYFLKNILKFRGRTKWQAIGHFFLKRFQKGKKAEKTSLTAKEL